MINVTRIYKRQAGGYKKVVGPIPEKDLALRSGAFKYVYLNNEDRFFVGDTGQELLDNIERNKFLQLQELFQFNVDINIKIVEAIQTEWKE